MNSKLKSRISLNKKKSLNIYEHLFSQQITIIYFETNARLSGYKNEEELQYLH